MDFWKRITEHTELAVSRYPKGLLKEKEIEDILATLRTAREKGKVGRMTYEYRPGPLLPGEGGGELLFLIPKDEQLLTARDRVQTALEQHYGLKYRVDLEW